MPQGRRKVPFSAKQKKIQLQQKRERKQRDAHVEDATLVSSMNSKKEIDDVDVINEQPATNSKYNPNRYRLMFKKEKNEEIEKRLALAQEIFEPLPEEKLEVSYEEVFVPGSVLDMPKRPFWDFSFTKEELEMREQKYFREYLESLEQKYGVDELSHFEMNLETWRQLWRVLEFSDIVLLITDIRFSVYHFSPVLYDFVTKELKKDMILVLNKIDLVPPALVLAWKEYFQKHFPMLKIMYFASYAGMILKEGKRGRRIGNLHMAVAGTRHLLKLCEEIVKDQVNLASWKQKIEIEAAEINSCGDNYVSTESEDEDDDDDKHQKSKQSNVKFVENDTSHYQGERFHDNILTIGFVGHPNVGKSSFLNAVCGKKVVSVSRTPGHTKHYQTIMLTPNVRLCDCPGLVFPSLVPKAIQVLMGCYPISQLREPYSVIAFLGQRVPLHNILKLRHPDYDAHEKDVKWSSYDICEAWAIKRGFHTAKTSRPDVYRAANNILRMALDGRTICLAFYPPNYTKEKEMWQNHPNLSEIIAVQAHRNKTEDYFSGFPAKYSDKGDEFNKSEDTSNEDSYTSEETQSASETEATSDNKFSLLGEDVNC